MSGDGLSSVGLDPDWVGRVVAGGGAGPRSVEFVEFVGTGQMSRLARYALEWAGDAGPATVLVKVPSSVATTRAMAFKRGPYLRECTFYASLAAELDVAVPRTYGVHYDADGLDFAIVQEDVATHRAGDQLADTGIPDLRAALHQAAALHAGCWQRMDDPVFAVYGEDLDAEVARTERTFPAMAEEVVGRWGDNLDPAVVAFVDRLLPLIGPWRRRRSRPDTLAHGDFRPDNLLFGRTDPDRPVVAVDWQLSTVGLATLDVAFLIGGALTKEARRAHEPELLDGYRRALATRGVDLDPTSLRHDYAIATVQGVVVAIGAGAMVDRTERGERLLSTMLNRHGRHALDWDPLRLLAGDGPGWKEC